MRNLLKEEFYKSNKGAVQYVAFSLVCLISILLVILYSDGGYLTWAEFQMALPFQINMMSFVVLLVMIYISAEFARGTVKNYLAVGFSRNQVFFAKFIKVLVIILGILFASQIVTLTFSPFILPGNNVDFFVGLGYYAYGLFAIFELVCFYVGISFIIRSVGGIVGVWITLNVVQSVIYSIPGFVNSSFFDFLATFIEYACFDYQAYVADRIFFMGTTPTDIIFAILVPLIISGLSIFGGLYYFNKTDVK